MDLYFPKILIKIKNKKHKLNWLTKGIRVSCKHKRTIRVILNHTNNTIIKKHYKIYRKLLKKSIIISKKISYIKQMALSENKTKTMWKIIKNKTNKDQKQVHKNIKLKINNETIESPKN